MKMMIQVLKSLIKKPFTRLYPKVRIEVEEYYKGRLNHDPKKCIYCGLCAKYCPSNAIKVDVKNRVWSFNLGKCLFCGQCEEVCHTMPKRDAIKLTKEYELASINKKDFKIVHKRKE